MATLQRIKSKQEEKQMQVQETSIFPTSKIVTEQQSIQFVKKLVAVGISSITYLRVIFPEEAYQDLVAEGLNLKMLNYDSKCPGSSILVSWIDGCFEAIEKKYLKQMTLALCVDAKNPNNALETYNFRFSYADDGVAQLDTIETIQNEGCKSLENKFEVKKPTLKMLRTIMMLTETMRPLPDDVMISMKLLYYDDVTPTNYEPKGFQPSDIQCYELPEDNVTFRVGDVSTAFHRLTLKTKISRKMLLGEDNRMEEKTEVCNENVAIAATVNIEDVDLNLGRQRKNLEVFDSPVVRSSRIRSRSCSSRSTPQSMKIVSQEMLNDENSSKVTSSFNNLALTLNNARLVPTSPAGSGIWGDNRTPAMSSNTGSFGSRRSGDSSLSSSVYATNDYPIRCPCKVKKDQGIMILCEVCKFWQHGACFTVIDENNAPDKHYCNVCADPPSLCTDPRICLSDEDVVQVTCLYRRTLVILSSLEGFVNSAKIAQLLGVDISLGVSIINRLLMDNILKPGTYTLASIIDKEVLLKFAFPNYLNKKVWQSPKNMDENMCSRSNDISWSPIDTDMTIDVEGSVNEYHMSGSKISSTAKKNVRTLKSLPVVLPNTQEMLDSDDENKLDGSQSSNRTRSNVKYKEYQENFKKRSLKLSFNKLRKRKALEELSPADYEISDSLESRRPTPKKRKTSEAAGIIG